MKKGLWCPVKSLKEDHQDQDKNNDNSIMKTKHDQQEAFKERRHLHVCDIDQPGIRCTGLCCAFVPDIKSVSLMQAID